MEPSVNLCMGCMNELDENGRCHHCSYTDDIPHLQAYLAPKTVLDNRYIIGKMLSYNGEGASYICYDMVGKCKCVCREYMPDTLCERDGRTQKIMVNPDCLAKYKTFMSEFADMNKVLSKMRNLNHIATAQDMFTENNTTYVILEYVEGVSLKKFLQSNTGFLTWDQVKKLFVPLFTTLSIIHNAGIIHRGISPENIIVTTNGELKLTGFCISSIRTSNTGLLPEFYSGYTAPEQYSSLEWQGTWTDVYAVAAVIYRILTGCMPLDAQTRTNNDTLVEACHINPRISPHISKVLSKAMAVKGKDRIQTITEFVAALFEQHSTHMEHEKGATQTIPIQHVPKKKSAAAKQPEKKKTNKTAVIMGWVVLAAVLGLSIFLLVELFYIPGGNDNSSSVKPAAVTTTEEDEEDDSDEYVYENTVSTSVTTNPDDLSPYGVGSIMPKVVGMDYDDVVSKLGKDFNITAEYYYSDTDDRGLISEQSIEEGADYNPKKKNKLVLKVCAGPEEVPVPEFSGYTKKDYLQLLDSLGIKYKIANSFSDHLGADYVMGTSTPVGKSINVKKGEVLTVTVSLGITTTKQTTVSSEPEENSSAAETSSQKPARTEQVNTKPEADNPSR